MTIIIPIIVAVIGVSIAAAVLVPRDSVGGFGALGSAHEHAVFAIKLDGNLIDFSQSKYQVQSRYIHVENGDGTTLHRHSTNVPFGEFLRSVEMNIQDNCFINDDGTEYCEDSSKQLRFYMNTTEMDSMMDYVIQPNDRILVIYGNETQQELAAEIDRLAAIEPKG